MTSTAIFHGYKASMVSMLSVSVGSTGIPNQKRKYIVGGRWSMMRLATSVLDPCLKSLSVKTPVHADLVVVTGNVLPSSNPDSV